MTRSWVCADESASDNVLSVVEFASLVDHLGSRGGGCAVGRIHDESNIHLRLVSNHVLEEELPVPWVH